jgi:hypothetical protein
MTGAKQIKAAHSPARPAPGEGRLLELTSDFAGIGPLGFILPRRAWLARHRSADLRYDRFGLTEVGPAYTARPRSSPPATTPAVATRATRSPKPPAPP